MKQVYLILRISLDEPYIERYAYGRHQFGQCRPMAREYNSTESAFSEMTKYIKPDSMYKFVIRTEWV